MEPVASMGWRALHDCHGMDSPLSGAASTCQLQLVTTNDEYCFGVETHVTAWTEQEANRLPADDLRGVLRVP